jgi:hypothetical protein
MGILLLVLLCTGCQARLVSTDRIKGEIPPIKNLVVFGFRPAIPVGDQPDVYRDAVTDGVHMAGPVPENVAYHMTQMLFDRLSETGAFTLSPPGKARGVFARIIDSDPAARLRGTEVLREVGRSLQGDAVVAGTIYRWRERVGADYGVERPASVAFSLYLVDSREGAVLWRGQFDKTQKSLTENIFDLSIFSRSGGKWLTAEQLSLIGLEQLIKDMPGIAAAKGADDMDEMKRLEDLDV